MDDFIPVFIAAVIFLAIMVLITVFVSFPGAVMNISVTSFSVGEVGYLTDYPTKTLDLKSFSVGETQEETLKSMPQIVVYRNILSANPESFVIGVPEWYDTTMRGIKLDFSVFRQSSIQFSKLVIKWNGLDVFREGGIADTHSIYIDKANVKSSNTLEIDTEYNAWWFWATATYTLRNFNVNIDYGPERLIPFNLLASDLQGFNKGQVNFDGSGGCDMIVRVNGVDVYDGTPDGDTKIEFTYQEVPLAPGGNIIAFVSKAGVCELRDAEFKVFLIGNEVTATRGFDVTNDNYNLLNQGFMGKIDYKIDSVMRTGSIVIKLNGASIHAPSPHTGWNTATFTISDVNQGENEISFSGTGAFDISDVRIMLEK
ncbi:hypothetical protein ACFLQO_01425 [Candidatus Aenigmatarchaeota archaeon]